ncbi:hypothetical protein PROFUN_16048 [Planoprotostelium fungivorum]|uniref:Uncharacterized protein n=1 Tax=Planoprotostelium fungivorum TaxID=1890364 RepID=A0A2P6MSR8_9EUKA|nr:hypothetical protein PROFUN_16048 [Planoprotostelium fungivorum]
METARVQITRSKYHRFFRLNLTDNILAYTIRAVFSPKINELRFPPLELVMVRFVLSVTALVECFLQLTESNR